jgi:hypothetical protein
MSRVVDVSVVRDDFYDIEVDSAVVLVPVGSGVGGSGRAEFTFTDADLSISGILVRQHNLGRVPVAIKISDSMGDRVYPDNEPDLTPNTIAIDLVSFRPLKPGQWKLFLMA